MLGDVQDNNLAPRAGFSYRIRESTVLRAGAGVYYNNNPATDNYLIGPSYGGNTNINGSLDGGVTRNASLADPFPTGLSQPQGEQYGKLAQWGLNGNAQAEFNFRNGDICQWNIGLQHQFHGNLLAEINYSGNRSHHLPLAYYSNRNVVSAATRKQLGTSGLNQTVANPFYSLFQGPNAVIDQPASIYNNPTVTQINLVRPYPQFPGAFSGWATGRLTGNGQYDALQVRAEKRYSRGLNFQGSYTYSTEYDDGPGSNTWLGGYYGFGQDPNDSHGEWSRGSGDAPNRFVFSGGYELPVGRGRQFGGNLNRWADAVVGGWQVNTILSLQSGFPLHLYLANGRIADGSQRPQLAGNPRSRYSIHEVVDNKGSYFKSDFTTAPAPGSAVIQDPGDQTPGNTPRYDPDIRGSGIKNLDASIFKKFAFGETASLEIRGEFFNFTNTPRFAPPDLGVGDATFGQINSQYNTARRTQLGMRFVF